jgi:hypothetical protein
VVVDIDTNKYHYVESIVDASLEFLKIEMQTLGAY